MAIRRLHRFVVFTIFGISMLYTPGCSQPLGLTTQENEITLAIESFHPTEDLQRLDQLEMFERIKTPIDLNSVTPEATKKSPQSAAVSRIPTPTPFPSIKDVAVKPIHDLYFLTAGELRVWSRHSGKIIPVLQLQAAPAPGVYQGRVAGYTVDWKNQRLIILRSTGISANGVELFNLELLDLITGTSRPLLEEIPAIDDISASPDGEWVTYSVRERGSKTIYSKATQHASEPAIIGTCPAETEHDWCEIIWPDRQSQATWNDREGVWLAAPPDFHRVKIAENTVQVEGLEGNIVTLEVRFANLRWSPNGRYLLALVQPLRSDIRWQVIIDTFRGRVIEVPDTFEFKESAAAVDWMPDGDLVVVHNQPANAGFSRKITLFSVIPTSTALLVEEQEFDISDPSSLGHEIDGINFLPQYVLPESERKLWVIFTCTREGLPARLYQIDIKFRTVLKTYSLPVGEIGYRWSDNGAEAILTSPPNGYYYLHKKYQSIYALESILGRESCCFQWMP